jgi:hypothetical protein
MSCVGVDSCRPPTICIAIMKFFRTIGTFVLTLSSVVSAASFTNPLKPRDGSDPHIVWTGGYYYMMTTTWTNLQITRAKTLGGLKNGETKTVWTDSNANRCCNMWAVSAYTTNLKYKDADAHKLLSLSCITLTARGISITLLVEAVLTIWIFNVHTCSKVGHTIWLLILTSSNHTRRRRRSLRIVLLPRTADYNMGH